MINSRLPHGFRWIPLASITSNDKLEPHEGYKKVPKNDMIAGFNKLRNDIIPIIGEKPNITKFDFAEMDGKNRKSFPDGLQRVFEAFFGDEPITLTITTTGYSATNGRHRITVARELRWTHIPAKII